MGRSLPVPPCLLARRVLAWAMAQGAPTAAVPGDSQGRRPDPQPSPTPHAMGLGQYNLSRKGATNPVAMLRPCPHTHRDTDTPLAWLSPSWSWCRQQPQAGAGGGQTQQPLSWLALWGGGAGTRDKDAGTGTAPHPVYKCWREETCSQEHGWQWLPWDQALLPAGTRVPHALPQQLPGYLNPMGRETPKWGTYRVWGSP